MRLLVISDTHKHIGRVLRLLQGAHRFDGVIHLGDHIRDAEDIESITDLPVTAVTGNCDWWSDGGSANLVMECEGKRLYLCHGHMEHVKYGDQTLRQLIREEGYDMALFGHTHTASVSYEGDSVLMNPGSISLPRDGAPSYGVIHIDERGSIHTNIVRIDK